MKGFVQYVKTKFQKHPVKLDNVDNEPYYEWNNMLFYGEPCMDDTGNGLYPTACGCEECDFKANLGNDTLEYIILFVIIGLVGYGGYKYFKK